MDSSVVWLTKGLQRLIAPMSDAIFLAIFSMCIFHESFSSICTPRDLTELTCLIMLPPMITLEKFGV